MSDIADDADAMMEKIHEAELAVRRPEGPVATGVCLHCGAEIGGRWCDVTCRDGWEYDGRRHGDARQ